MKFLLSFLVLSVFSCASPVTIQTVENDAVVVSTDANLQETQAEEGEVEKSIKADEVCGDQDGNSAPCQIDEKQDKIEKTEQPTEQPKQEIVPAQDSNSEAVKVDELMKVKPVKLKDPRD